MFVNDEPCRQCYSTDVSVRYSACGTKKMFRCFCCGNHWSREVTVVVATDDAEGE